MFEPGIKILIVDDMMTMRKLMKRALTELGFSNFMEAADGAQAWEICNTAANNIGLVVSDWNMPNCTGLDLLKRVRADGRLKGMPFLLVTAESEKSQVVQALQAGVTGYIVKPFDAETIRKRLEEASQKAA